MPAPAIELRPELGGRALFPTLHAKAYLAHAAISPLSQPASQAVRQVVTQMEEQGAPAFAEILSLRQRVRQSLATLISAAEEDIAFVQNTGAGLSAIATALTLRPGDRLLLFEGEYPSNVATFQQAALRAGASVTFAPANAYLKDNNAALAALEQELQRGLRMVAVSAVQFQTGLRMPLGEIGALCRAYDALLCVDAVQALGAVPINVESMHIDFLACGAHKWLMGLDGVGLVYVRPQAMAQLQPQCVGAMSFEGGLDMLGGDEGQLRYDRSLIESARVFEGGMVSSASMAALDASLTLIQMLGVEAIYAHIQKYHDALEPLLEQRGFLSVRSKLLEQRSGILSLKPPRGIHVGSLVAEMQADGIVCSSPDGHLRVAPHWPNALAEISDVVAAVEQATARLTR